MSSGMAEEGSIAVAMLTDDNLHLPMGKKDGGGAISLVLVDY